VTAGISELEERVNLLSKAMHLLLFEEKEKISKKGSKGDRKAALRIPAGRQERISES
jgi:hypothetical protein